MLSDIEQRIIQNIDLDEMVTFLQKLVQTNSENPGGNEEACAQIIAQELESFECTTHLQYVENNRPNVIGCIEGHVSEKLLFNGHTDTVKVGNLDNWTLPPLSGALQDGLLYGRGSCDMKAGLVSMIFAMKALKKSNINFHKGILFTGVIDEEVYFKGTKALITENMLQDCSLAFVSEPTSLQVVTQHKGAIEYLCEVEGRSAHSGKAHQGINAISRMAKIIEKLEEYNCNLAQHSPHPLFHTPTLNIGTIKGGVGVTFVPEYCCIEFDRQILPGEHVDKVARELETIFSKSESEFGFPIKVSITQSFGSWQVQQGASYVQNFQKTFLDTLGRNSEFGGLHGYCEAEILERAGIPSLVFGPGNIDYAHAPDEHVAVHELLEAAKVYAIVAYRFVSEQ